MKGIYREIDDFLETMEIVTPCLSFKRLKSLMDPLRRTVDHFFGEDSFENQRLAILIYLAQNYLLDNQRDLWFKHYRINLVKKYWISNGQRQNSEIFSNLDEYEPDNSDDDSIATEISEIINDSEVEDLVDLEETADNIPEKIIEINLPVKRHDNHKQTCMAYDQDYQFYQSVHHLERALINQIYEKNLSSDLIEDLGYSQTYIQQRFDYYRSVPQAPQKSDEWLKQRTNCITASALADSLGHKGKQARQNLLLNKVSGGQYRPFKGNFYTRWGEKYEDVACAIYSYRLGVEVYDFGLLPHNKYPMLGASTDGITSKLINLEIKCPPSRVITGQIPKYYWEQIQLQLEVLNLPLSHFLECRIEEYDSAQAFYQSFKQTSDLPEKGIIIEVMDMTREKEGLPSRTHRFSPIELHNQPELLKEWHRNQIRTILATEHLIIGTESYWYLDAYSCINVQRDFKWFQENLNGIFEFWSEVEKYRELGFEHLLAKVEKERLPVSNSDLIKLELATEVCLLDDSDDEPSLISKKPPITPVKKQTKKTTKSSGKYKIIEFDLV